MAEAHASHVPKLAGDVVFCDVCGAYGTARALRLTEPCLRRPPNPIAAWRRGELRRGRHPTEKRYLGQPIVIMQAR